MAQHLKTVRMRQMSRPIIRAFSRAAAFGKCRLLAIPPKNHVHRKVFRSMSNALLSLWPLVGLNQSRQNCLTRNPTVIVTSFKDKESGL